VHEIVVNVFGYLGSLAFTWILAVMFTQSANPTRRLTVPVKLAATLLLAATVYFSGYFLVLLLKFLLTHTPAIENEPFAIHGGIFIGLMLGLLIAKKQQLWFQSETKWSKWLIDLVFYSTVVVVALPVGIFLSAFAGNFFANTP